jgi:hypothetical protein
MSFADYGRIAVTGQAVGGVSGWLLGFVGVPGANLDVLGNEALWTLRIERDDVATPTTSRPVGNRTGSVRCRRSRGTQDSECWPT